MIGTIKQLIPKMLELEQDKIYEVKEYKERRSLDANAYYWSLIGQISEKLREHGTVIGKEELHFKYLKEYGQGYTIPLPANQNIEGYIKYYEYQGKGNLNGIEVKFYRIYKPSHEMNSKEFWLLIKGVEHEAQQLGIETLEEKKLRELVEQLDKKGD